MNDFRMQLPRLTELYDRFVSSDRNNFFLRFPQRLQFPDTVTLAYYRKIENWLSFVPASQWSLFQEKIGPTATACDTKNKRDWEKLHDTLNEALGAKILQENYGCSDVVIVPTRGNSKSPDWRGMVSTRPHYAEVKTVNHSLNERLSWYGDDKLLHTTKIPPALAKKITDSYTEAIEQLNAPLDAQDATKLVVFILNPDHNFDPIEEDLKELLMTFLEEIEIPETPIYACIQH